ncbi:MAG: tetratricopeptide repeat protein [Candidatus Obscuribacterales bacterium]|nr:tetratricopeptide repeat protein [Candidatus Obscuribacterales bacterium]
MLDKPPDTIPDDLSAQEYLQLGNWFIEAQQLDKARDALSRVVVLAASSESTRAARALLATRIPANEISEETIKAYFDTLTLSFRNRKTARAGLEQMIGENSDFEWPLFSLADMDLRRGDLQSAETLLRKALTINPLYAQALIAMARLEIINMNYTPALELLDKVEQLTPDDELIPELRRATELITALDN